MNFDGKKLSFQEKGMVNGKSIFLQTWCRRIWVVIYSFENVNIYQKSLISHLDLLINVFCTKILLVNRVNIHLWKHHVAEIKESWDSGETVGKFANCRNV